jgi:membrane-associated phospholipid phosphatase
MTDIQIAIIQALQSQADWLAIPMLFFSFLGSAEFYLLAIPILYWCWDPRLGLRLGILLGISTGLNEALKIAFHMPRPYWVSPQVKAFASYSSFGLPSAHAQDAVTFWGLIAATARRRGVWVLAVLLIFLIGVSRIFAGVHYPIDTIAGWVVGIVVLAAFLRWEEPVGRRLAALPLSRQILIAFVGSLALASLSLIALAAIGNWQLPHAWAEGALARSGEPIDPLFPRDALIAAGLLFGFSAGAAILKHRSSMCAAGLRSVRLIRYAVGIGVTGLIWFGFGFAIPSDPTLPAFAFQYLRAVAAALWISYGAPEAFAILNLVVREEKPVLRDE